MKNNDTIQTLTHLYILGSHFPFLPKQPTGNFYENYFVWIEIFLRAPVFQILA